MGSHLARGMSHMWDKHSSARGRVKTKKKKKKKKLQAPQSTGYVPRKGWLCLAMTKLIVVKYIAAKTQKKVREKNNDLTQPSYESVFALCICIRPKVANNMSRQNS